MVDTRKDLAHKLPGAASSFIGVENVCKEQGSLVDTLEDGQHNGGCLYRQSWMDSIQGIGLPDPRFVDVVPGEKYSYPSTAPTGGDELHSGHGIEIHEKSIRLETGSTNVSENQ